MRLQHRKALLLLLFGIGVVVNLTTIRIFESSIAALPSENNPTVTVVTVTVPYNHHGKVTAKQEEPLLRDVRDVCRPNVIVYLAQKGNHSSYQRDSYGLLTKSLDLLYEHYLNEHFATASLLIFHTGEFTDADLHELEQRQAPQTHGTMQLVDISSTQYWQLPSFLEGETPKDWFLPDYTVGYRHMMRWYALKLYEFLRNDWPCNYKYVMRMDEESFIYSPIRYDMFEFMATHKYQYGFRMCSFEMRHMKPLWKEYSESRQLEIQRPGFVSQDLCGFYNNWFILDMNFIFQPDVQDWLQWMDGTGYIYRKRVNDLIIHTAAVYAFLPPSQIHRFLDFTYQHFTNYKHSKCPLWGAIAGGYADEHALETVMRYHASEIVAKQCPRPGEKKPYFPRVMNISVQDLSPTYHHLTDTSLTLPEVAAGHCDLQNVGIRSG